MIRKTKHVMEPADGKSLRPHMLVGTQTRPYGRQACDTGLTPTILGGYEIVVSNGSLTRQITQTHPVRRNLASLYALKYQSGEKICIVSVMTAQKASMKG